MGNGVTKVLVVEDDPGVQGMLELMLATEGLETEAVSDGIEAMARLDGPPPDLVLLDVMMPGTDGFSVLKAIRGLKAWKEVPVVVVSAAGADEDLWTGWQSGADHYLVKPFDADELREVILDLLSDRGAPQGDATSRE